MHEGAVLGQSVDYHNRWWEVLRRSELRGRTFDWRHWRSSKGQNSVISNVVLLLDVLGIVAPQRLRIAGPQLPRSRDAMTRLCAQFTRPPGWPCVAPVNYGTLQLFPMKALDWCIRKAAPDAAGLLSRRHSHQVRLDVALACMLKEEVMQKYEPTTGTWVAASAMNPLNPHHRLQLEELHIHAVCNDSISITPRRPVMETPDARSVILPPAAILEREMRACKVTLEELFCDQSSVLDRLVLEIAQAHAQEADRAKPARLQKILANLKQCQNKSDYKRPLQGCILLKRNLRRFVREAWPPGMRERWRHSTASVPSCMLRSILSLALDTPLDESWTLMQLSHLATVFMKQVDLVLLFNANPSCFKEPPPKCFAEFYPRVLQHSLAVRRLKPVLRKLYRTACAEAGTVPDHALVGYRKPAGGKAGVPGGRRALLARAGRSGDGVPGMRALRSRAERAARETAWGWLPVEEGGAAMSEADRALALDRVWKMRRELRQRLVALMEERRVDMTLLRMPRMADLVRLRRGVLLDQMQLCGVHAPPWLEKLRLARMLQQLIMQAELGMQQPPDFSPQGAARVRALHRERFGDPRGARCRTHWELQQKAKTPPRQDWAPKTADLTVAEPSGFHGRDGAEVAEMFVPEDAAEVLWRAKMQDIVIIDTRQQSSSFDHIVLATARSEEHLFAAAQAVYLSVKERGVEEVLPGKHLSLQGRLGDDWVVVDCGHTLINCFMPQERSRMDLEGTWHTQLDAPMHRYPPPPAPDALDATASAEAC